MTLQQGLEPENDYEWTRHCCQWKLSIAERIVYGIPD